MRRWRGLREGRLRWVIESLFEIRTIIIYGELMCARVGRKTLLLRSYKGLSITCGGYERSTCTRSI